MSWALGRRLFIIGLVAFVVLVVAGFVIFSTTYKAPSCIDGKQNETEEGVDCGGDCPYLCDAGLILPSVEFARFVFPQGGRTDVIAYVENSNPSAAAIGVPYSIELLNSANAVVARKEGTIDLPPSSVVPVFVPNFFSGNQEVVRVFMDIDETGLRWFTYYDTRPDVRVSQPTIEGGNAPRIRATLNNPSAYPLQNIPATIAVFNEKDNVIAASATIISVIPAQGSAQAVFTWNVPFSEDPKRIEILPVLPL